MASTWHLCLRINTKRHATNPRRSTADWHNSNRLTCSLQRVISPPYDIRNVYGMSTGDTCDSHRRLMGVWHPLREHCVPMYSLYCSRFGGAGVTRVLHNASSDAPYMSASGTVHVLHLAVHIFRCAVHFHFRGLLLVVVLQHAGSSWQVPQVYCGS